MKIFAVSNLFKAHIKILNSGLAYQTMSTPDPQNIDIVAKFRKLKNLAFASLSKQEFSEALKYYRQAYEIHKSEGLKKKIDKIKDYLERQKLKHIQTEATDFQPSLTPTESSLISVDALSEITEENNAQIEKENDNSSFDIKYLGNFCNTIDINDSLEGYLEALDFNTLIAKYQYLTESANTFFDLQQFSEALLYYEEAFKIDGNNEVKRKIGDIKAILKLESLVNLVDDIGVPIVHGFSINRELLENLYSYQKEGVKWMLKLHEMKKGGILADDMGLGKTLQVIVFLTGLLKSKLIKSALIIMPASLISNWEMEFIKWNIDIRVLIYHNRRETNLAIIRNRGGILLTSYGTLVSAVDQLSGVADGQKYNWDYLILDEGHQIKNPTLRNKATHEIVARHRLVLSGTPIQNSLKELWALYDFCHQGQLLGNFRTFQMRYENVINRSREKDATAVERTLGNKMAENLKNLIAPYFLRRTKADTIKSNENLDSSDKNDCVILPRKNEFVVWLFLSDQQIDIYKKFLISDEVKQILMTKKSPLLQLLVLKKICDHPRLLTKNACHRLSLNDRRTDELLNDSQMDTVSINVDTSLLIKESGKMRFLITLLENLKDEGHRTLVFSTSIKILDIIEKILSERHWNIMRIDGTTKMSERQSRINEFQSCPRYPVFLLTSRVGGVGLTLTAADRVIIYDPSWNPANDAQAIDRAYRIGQKKDVVVYRLITCGTIEEKIYRRQIFKDSIMKQATCSNLENNIDPHRYFSHSELRELFILDNPKESKTQKKLHKLHSRYRKATPELSAHVTFLLSLQDIYGISDHDLMFKSIDIREDITANDGTLPSEDDYMISEQVEEAQLQLELESINNTKVSTQNGTYKTSYFGKNKEKYSNDIRNRIFVGKVKGKETATNKRISYSVERSSKKKKNN